MLLTNQPLTSCGSAAEALWRPARNYSLVRQAGYRGDVTIAREVLLLRLRVRLLILLLLLLVSMRVGSVRNSNGPTRLEANDDDLAPNCPWICAVEVEAGSKLELLADVYGGIG